MLVSWRWISELVDTRGVDPRAFAERFTMSVAEIDDVLTFGDGLADVRVAHVVDVVPHPSADKLRLAVCDFGDAGQITVVCGAPDLEVGILVPFAPPGVTLASGIEVRDGQVRGVPSPGMLCSERDLGLSDEHGGLMRLDGVRLDQAGEALTEATPIDDVLWELDNKSITHRPDLWGHLGIAREVAALLGRPLKPPRIDGLSFTELQPVDLHVADDSCCRRYLCARISGVLVAPSPISIRMRLRSLGVRPISNVVDATNLVMLETGNPLHAFDARHVRGGAIVVRNAEPGELLMTLDGTERALDPTDCVIADAKGPVALAGVMGGADSEIKDDTHTVILEAASFDGAAIRKTASRLGMRTESSARFEKHLDPTLADTAARRFLVTLSELSPGCQIDSALADGGPFVGAPPPATTIHTTSAYMRSRLGLSEDALTDEFIDTTLRALAFDVHRDGDAMVVGVPTFRAGRDIGIAEDIVEELGRIYGYDRIPSVVPDVPSKPPFMPPIKLLERKVRTACAHDAGLAEVLLYSFDDEPFRARVGVGEGSQEQPRPRVALRHALSADASHLRRTLTSNLLAALERNLVQGAGQQASKKGLRVGLFEVGRVFLPDERDADPDIGIPRQTTENPDRQRAWQALLSGPLAEGTEQAIANATALPRQPKRLAIAIGERIGGGADGSSEGQPPAELTRELFAGVVGALQAVAARCGRPELAVSRRFGGSPVTLDVSWLHPGRHGVVRCADRAIGVVTALHPALRQRLQVPAEVVLAEIELDALLDVVAEVTVGAAPPRFPATGFDLTIDVDRWVRAEDLRTTLLSAARHKHAEIIEDIRLIGFFDADARRSLTYRITCRRPDATLTDDELAAVRESVQNASTAAASGAPSVAGSATGLGAP